MHTEKDPEKDILFSDGDVRDARPLRWMARNGARRINMGMHVVNQYYLKHNHKNLCTIYELSKS